MRNQLRTPIRFSIIWAFLSAFTGSVPLAAQTAASHPSFEVATIKPMASGGRVELPNGGFVIQGPSITWKGGTLTLRNYSLKRIIEEAWDVQDDQVQGPAWLDSESFQIVAKAPPNTTEEQARILCQSLLADRFGLVLHREQRELPVYALVRGKGNPKLKKGAAGRDDNEDAPTRAVTSKLSEGRVYSPKASLSWLAETLTKRLGKPVIDETGIRGEFSISLDWTPDPADPPLFPGGKTPPPGYVSDTTSGPSIFTAIQEQLGLKLEARKAMRDVLVIDHIERASTAN